MNPRPHVLALAFLAGACSTFAKGGTAYLAMIGPAPLRFAKRIDPVVAEPMPVPTPEKAPDAKELGKKPDAGTSGDSRPPVIPEVPGVIDPPPIPPPPPPVIPPIGQAADVSPYQILQYLLKPTSTNAVQPVVVLPPINFAPPSPAAPAPSSTATYQKGP